MTNVTEQFERQGDGWEGFIGGSCPVQGSGTIDGHAWYFRARGDSWRMEFAENKDVCHYDMPMVGSTQSGWRYEEKFGKWPEAGYMTPDVAWGFAQQTFAAFREKRLPYLAAVTIQETPFFYEDEQGEERTTLTNNGRELFIQLRGVHFSGVMFDDFTPAEGTPEDMLSSFTLHHGCLVNCRMRTTQTIPLLWNDKPTQEILAIEIFLGKPDHRNAIDREDIFLSMNLHDIDYKTSGKSGWFEEELEELQDMLPDDITMKICFNCQYGDYSPLGHGTFANMICFRDHKEAYMKSQDKSDYMEVCERACGNQVQEIGLCEEFTRRRPGSGYRG